MLIRVILEMSADKLQLSWIDTIWVLVVFYIIPFLTWYFMKLFKHKLLMVLTPLKIDFRPSADLELNMHKITSVAASDSNVPNVQTSEFSVHDPSTSNPLFNQQHNLSDTIIQS